MANRFGDKLRMNKSFFVHLIVKKMYNKYNFKDLYINLACSSVVV